METELVPLFGGNYHPIELDTAEKLKQRLDYLYENPVRSGLDWSLGTTNIAAPLIIILTNMAC